MQEVAKGDLNTSVPDTVLLKNDSFNTEEFSLIAENLNEMIQKLQLYIDRSYKYEISRQEAEYRALQSQINPHFLYNTLNCFISMNRLGMKKELEDSIIQLTRIFRYTCNNAKLTTVKEEFAFCTQYCQLLKMRYDERLTFHCQVEEEAAGISIPRLLIQPLVENAIYHGIRNVRRMGHIRITGRLEEEQVILAVEDNGKGFPQESDRLTQSGEKGDLIFHRKGFGMFNADQRIKLYFGSDYGLRVHSERDVGTCVEICLPRKPYEEAQDDFSFNCR